MEPVKRERRHGRLRARIRNMSLKSAFVAYMLMYLGMGLFLGSLLSSLVTNLEYDTVLRYGEAAGKSEDLEFEFFNSVGVLWEDGTFQAYSDADSLLLRVTNMVSGVGGPMVFLLFAMLAGRRFYRNRLKASIALLTESAKKIGANDLDFTISYPREDEMGELCAAFEIMRSELEQNSRDAWRVAEERKRLSAAFSHDLRTPLTVLKGRAQMLEQYVRRGELTQERSSSAAQKISAQVERLERYTESMSGLQKLEDLVPEPVETSLAPFLSSLREEAEMLCAERGKELVWTLRLEDAALLLDPRMVSQVFDNLLENGLRYAYREVEVSFLRSGDKLLLTITDDGPGFSDEERAVACEPFYRGGKAESGGHFGLGLHICKLLCEKQGGGLRLQNAPGGGAMAQAFFRVS